MIADNEGNEITSDEVALAFMFAIHAHGDDSTEGELRVPQPLRHKLIEKTLKKIVTQFEVELAIPWVKGRFGGIGATIIYLDEPDFGPHTKLYDPNSFVVIETFMEKGADDGDMLLSGFDAYIRLGESNTWLCIGIKPPPDEPGLLDFNDEAGSELDILGLDAPALSEENTKIICDIAAQIATSEGFSSVALRVEPREQFAAKFVKLRIGELIEPELTERQLVLQAADIARNYWEFAVVPMLAKELKLEGKTASKIAKELGITKQRAERAIEMSIENGINAKTINTLVQKHLKG